MCSNILFYFAGDKTKKGVFSYDESNRKQKDHPDNEEAVELMKQYSLEPKLP